MSALEEVADLSVARLVALDHKVDEAEGDGILARWAFGRALLAERVGKQTAEGSVGRGGQSDGQARTRAALAYEVR